MNKESEKKENIFKVIFNTALKFALVAVFLGFVVESIGIQSHGTIFKRA